MNPVNDSHGLRASDGQLLMNTFTFAQAYDFESPHHHTTAYAFVTTVLVLNVPTPELYRSSRNQKDKFSHSCLNTRIFQPSVASEVLGIIILTSSIMR